ncbi:MAG: BolA/IbaG family iron-sulfur metabolism protein [gamma proteobacterium symbiont of Bathyaustriella thionipta]|nr:BolA/IbaG family iron-sulfur metabolism protein [gamma proteobacterium symbiont of Bathyaustriella thionipta]
MSMQQTIQNKLQQALQPLHLEVINESHMHNVPPDSESHFKLVVVTERFENKTLIKRHRTINALLQDELNAGIHALSMYTMTPQEWFNKGGEIPQSPPCLGGGKTEASS